MENNELRRFVGELAKNGEGDYKIAKKLGFKSTIEFTKAMSSIERDNLDYVGYYDYKY